MAYRYTVRGDVKAYVLKAHQMLLKIQYVALSTNDSIPKRKKNKLCNLHGRNFNDIEKGQFFISHFMG